MNSQNVKQVNIIPVRIEIIDSSVTRFFYLWLEFTIHVNEYFEFCRVSAISYVCPVEMA